MSSVERSPKLTLTAARAHSEANTHPTLMAILMVAIVLAGVAGVVVALSMGHAAFVLSIVLITFGLIAAASIC
ncbi:hypothetical protein BayCH28_04190 [Mycolicibacterium sp. CH28]|uniref:hypothetical protein n=1 Tax=Mycolicibacterium sp. CH28 TaxID=2512237 RepID=UPI0010803145|nr:hypothetical protein [Mycolicibacterium sp. CH28]TGD89796.1 hypothetical protein BayCH28_04190 [Mycolicibacterium sp. CH28]